MSGMDESSQRPDYTPIMNIGANLSQRNQQITQNVSWALMNSRQFNGAAQGTLTGIRPPGLRAARVP